MGQVMLEGCEMQCQKIGIQTRKRTRSQTYFSNMGAQLPQFSHNELEYLKRSKSSLLRNNQFLLQLNALPSQYAEYVNHLFVNKTKFQDKVFPACATSIIWGGGQSENDWARLSDMNENVAQIYRKISSGGGKSKVLQILDIIEQNFPGCIQQIKPIYMNKVGLAVCRLHINGNVQQVVIDDQIPTSHLKYFTSTNSWYFLVQKALAKLIGTYAFLEEFTLPQLFQEITGLPFQISKRKGEGWLYRDSSVRLSQVNISSFRQVIQDEKVCYLQGGDENSDVYNVRIIPGHVIRAFSFQNTGKSVSLFKIKIIATQKISLRVSYLNPKFQTSQTHSTFVDSQIILYQSSNTGYILHEKDNVCLGNNLYLGCPFMKLTQGQYLLYIRRDNTTRKASLVTYAGQKFTIKQIQSKQICNQILAKLKKYERK